MLAAIKKNNLPTLSEDEFLDLIATRKGPGDGKGYDKKTKKKMEKEQKGLEDKISDMRKKCLQRVIEADPKGQLLPRVGGSSQNFPGNFW